MAGEVVLAEAGRPDTTKALQLGGGLTLEEIKSIGQVFQQSGMFKDTKSAAQAITKVLAGQELGVPPMQAMRGIHVVDGNPQLSAGLIGALIKRSNRYDYRVVTSDDTECKLEWRQRTDAGAWEVVGESKFTIAQAEHVPTKEYGREIKLSEKTNWKTYTEDMLFARALTRGARRYCPDVFGGAVYTLGEAAPDQDDLPAPYVQPTPDAAYKPPRVDVLHPEDSRPADESDGAPNPTDPPGGSDTSLFPPSQDELDALEADQAEHKDPTDA
jgi:hypothetical protein